MTALKLISVGNSVGVIIPKELLARLKVQKGDTLFAVETPDGLRLPSLIRSSRHRWRTRAAL